MIKNAKTGKDQFIPLQDDVMLRRLKKWMHKNDTLNSDESLFYLSYAHLSNQPRKGLSSLDLGDVGFTPHSLRHSGATLEWLGGAAFTIVMLKGRWESDKS